MLGNETAAKKSVGPKGLPTCSPTSMLHERCDHFDEESIMSNTYDRDLTGYGKTPPHPKWPQEARIAVSFVLNYEEGGERSNER